MIERGRERSQWVTNGAKQEFKDREGGRNPGYRELQRAEE